jgi:hypothetical protein
MKKGSIVLKTMFVMPSLLSLNSPVYAGKVALGPEEVSEDDLLSIMPEEVLAKAMAEHLDRSDLCSLGESQVASNCERSFSRKRSGSTGG